MDEIVEATRSLAVEGFCNLLFDFLCCLLCAHLKGQLLHEIVDVVVVVELGDAGCDHHQEHVDDDAGILTDQVVGYPAQLFELLECFGFPATDNVYELRSKQKRRSFCIYITLYLF